MINSKPLSIEECVVGQIITEPVIFNGEVICNPGTPFSNDLYDIFKEHGITTIYVSGIYGNVNKSLLTIDGIDNVLLKGYRRSSTEQIKLIVNNLIKSILDSNMFPTISYMKDRDVATYDHMVAVAELAGVFGIKLGFTVSELRTLLFASLLHDIGKLFVPQDIINKHGKLTSIEYKIMKSHSMLGAAYVKGTSNVSTDVVSAILYHHENHDGTGYPNRLRDYSIPKYARILHIVDVYNALVSPRPYKDALPADIVRSYLRDKSCTMFDPILVRKFINTMPYYIRGDQIKYSNVNASVVDDADTPDPLVAVHGKDIVRLSSIISKEYSTKSMDEIITYSL